MLVLVTRKEAAALMNGVSTTFFNVHYPWIESSQLWLAMDTAFAKQSSNTCMWRYSRRMILKYLEKCTDAIIFFSLYSHDAGQDKTKQTNASKMTAKEKFFIRKIKIWNQLNGLEINLSFFFEITKKIKSQIFQFPSVSFPNWIKYDFTAGPDIFIRGATCSLAGCWLVLLWSESNVSQLHHWLSGVSSVGVMREAQGCVFLFINKTEIQIQRD